MGIIVKPAIIREIQQEMNLTTGLGYVDSGVSPVAVGYSSVYNTLLRGGFQFDVGAIPSNVKIVSATLKTHITNDIARSEGKVDVEVGRLLGNGGVSGSSGKFTVKYAEPDHDRDIDVTVPVKAIVEGRINNGTVMLYGNPTIVAGHMTSIRIRLIELIVEYETPPTKPRLLFPTGGEVLDGIHDINWEPSTDAETPQDQLSYQIQLSKNNGDSWEEIGTATNGATSFSYDFSNEPEVNYARIRVRAFDGYLYSDWDQSLGAFMIQRNVAPTAPTNLIPKGSLVDLTNVIQLSWKFNDINTGDIQTKADVQYRKQGTASWTSATVNSTNTYYFVPPNTFTKSNIEWRVRTYDRAGLVSPWSATSVFSVDLPSNAPVIITPEAEVGVSKPLIQWGSSGQTSYQVVLEELDGTVLWDTGEVISSSKSVVSGVDLINGARYRIKIRIKDGTDIFSPYADREFLVSYTPPAKATIKNNPHQFAVHLLIDNPDPIDTQPYVTHNDVYKLINGTWVRVAKYIQGEFLDYAVASGDTVQYRIRSYGQNGTQSDSDVFTASVNLKHPTFSSVDTDKIMELKHMTVTSLTSERERSFFNFAGRVDPVPQYGIAKTVVYNFAWIAIDREEAEEFYAMFDNDEILLYRDAEGRKSYVSVPVLSENEMIGGIPLYDYSFDAHVISFNEEV